MKGEIAGLFGPEGKRFRRDLHEGRRPLGESIANGVPPPNTHTTGQHRRSTMPGSEFAREQAERGRAVRRRGRADVYN